MSLLKTLSKKLTPEQLQEVQDALGDDFNYDMIPRSRLNAVIKQRDAYKEQLAGLSQGSEDDDDDDDDDNVTSNGAKGTTTKKSDKPLTTKALNKLLADKDAERDAALLAQRIEFATREKLRDAKARDLDIVFSLLDKSKLTFDDSNKLSGLDDQLVALQKSKEFLFDTGTSAETGTGRHGGTGGAGSSSELDSKLEDVFSNYGISVEDAD